MPERTGIELSVVVPFLNEGMVLLDFCERLRNHLDSLDSRYEVILVNDGSTDDSLTILRDLRWKECTVVTLARNSGHQAALEAGIEQTSGDWVVTLDADLQHPPELIGTMLRSARSGSVDVVYAQRTSHGAPTYASRITSSLYYFLMRVLVGVDILPSTADFRLMSARVVSAAGSLPGDKIYRMLLPKLGYSFEVIPYEPGQRFAGTSKYSVRQKVDLAIKSTLNFSARPLYLISALGFVVAIVAITWFIFVIASYIAGNVISGWASLASIVLLLGSAILLSIGVVAAYVAKIFELSQAHPRFVITDRHHLGGKDEGDGRA